MTLRRFDRGIVTALALAWAALMVVQVTPGTNQHGQAQKRSEVQKRTAPAVFYGPKVPDVKHATVKRTTNDTLSARSGGVSPGVSFGPWMDFVATAYDGQDDGMNGTASGLTSTGTRPRAWVTAAIDPSVIPYGTELELQLQDGRDVFLKAEDTGGAIRGNRIDIFIPSREQCFQFGRENVLVRVISRK